MGSPGAVEVTGALLVRVRGFVVEYRLRFVTAGVTQAAKTSTHAAAGLLTF